jgi:hypothetical protein
MNFAKKIYIIYIFLNHAPDDSYTDKTGCSGFFEVNENLCHPCIYLVSYRHMMLREFDLPLFRQTRHCYHLNLTAEHFPDGLGVFLSEGISGQHQNPINLENEKN